MARPNNLKLLILSLSLLAIFHSAKPDSSPPVQSPSPGPTADPADGPTSQEPETEPADGPTPISAPSPSPTSAKNLSSDDDVASPPSSDSDPPSTSISLDSDDGSTDSEDDTPDSDAEDGPTVSDLGSTKSDDGFSVSDLGSTMSKDSNIDLPSDLDFSTIIGQPAEVSPKVKEICDSTDHPALCLATVVPFLKGKDDIPSVLEIVIDAGAKLSNYGLSLIKSLAEKPDTPPEVVSVLNDCKESYDTAVTNFQNTIDAFRERDIGTMNSMLSAVITDVGDCEDGFSGLGEKSMLSDLAVKLTNVTSNCLAIVSLLH